MVKMTFVYLSPLSDWKAIEKNTPKSQNSKVVSSRLVSSGSRKNGLGIGRRGLGEMRGVSTSVRLRG